MVAFARFARLLGRAVVHDPSERFCRAHRTVLATGYAVPTNRTKCAETAARATAHLHTGSRTRAPRSTHFATWQ